MTDKAPLVSILTPTYNRDDFLPLAIESVLNQDYTNYEMLVVDDGSTDNTREVMEKYLQDERIKYSYQENQGQSVARNKALKNCKGHYICFLDSDNLFNPGKLSKQVAKLESLPEVDIIYGDNQIIDVNGEVISDQNMLRHSGMIYKELLIDNFVSMNTAMVRRKCFDTLGGLDESIRVADDYDLWLRFSTRFKYHYEREFYSQYRVMDDQISSDKTRRFNSNLKIIEKSMSQNPELLTDSERRYVRCRFFIRRGNYYCSVGQRKEGLSDYLSALRQKLFSKYPWKALMRFVFKKNQISS